MHGVRPNHSQRDRWPWLVAATLLLFSLAALLMTGCGQATAGATDVPQGPTGTPPPSQPTAVPTDDAPAAPTVITLTIWTTETFSPTQAITSGQILALHAANFEANQSDISIQFMAKKPHGKGGILDFLLTTQAVVPELLPDLVFIDVDELDNAVQAGLVQPLDDLLSPSLVSDLYPFARQSCTYDGRLYGLQFQADLDHLVYNTGQMTIAPSSWPGVLSNPGPYLFPAGGQAGLVNDAFLIQYLAVRAQPSEGIPEGPFLDVDAVVAVLQFYQDGVSRGIFPTNISDYHDSDECWHDYLSGEAALTHVSAHRYLADRGNLQASAVAPIPAINGPGGSLSRGWVLALVTADPTRQSLAVEFMTGLMSPETNAAWNRAASYLPTRVAALANWDETDSYTHFLQQQLQSARPRPVMPDYTQAAAALQEAVEDVLGGSTTPEEAAAKAIEKVH
jgi:arabinogalactan oligomer/maltooligosaccharide transport system substrate-binding protein